MRTFILFLALGISAPTAIKAAETPESRPSHAPIRAGDLLAQSELKVLIQHYEKILGESFEARLQLELMKTEAEPVSKEEASQKRLSMERRVKVLVEWQDQLRHRIEMLVAGINRREEEIRATETKRLSKPAETPPSRVGQPPAPRY